jgi:small-conductance mechanosensitive channel
VLSVAALAGAILIVSKELILCIFGYAQITLFRPFKVGDFVEIGGNKGRVIDIHAFYLTLAETGALNQLTGKTLTLPTQMVLLHNIRNESATGEYLVVLYTIPLPLGVSLEKAEAHALQAADRATSGSQAAAENHFKKIEDAFFLDLPSAKPKVLWQAADEKKLLMTIRFACLAEDRVSMEQRIFKEFWQAMYSPHATVLTSN